MPSQAWPVDYDPFADDNMPKYGGLSAIDSADINPAVRQRPAPVDPLANTPELKGGNLNPYTPTWRDTVGDFIVGDSDRFSRRRDLAGKLVGSTGIPTGQLNMADLTPLGGVFGAQEAAQRGDYKGAALAGLTALPGAGALEKGAVGAGERAISRAVPVEGDPFITAYHGSPHDFDKFDVSKIGTGEGAQAYGHGLYFAGNEGVAASYRDALSKQTSPIWKDASGAAVDIDALARNAKAGDPTTLAASFLQQENSVDDALRFAQRLSPEALGGQSEKDTLLQGLQSFKDAGLVQHPPGKMYQVQINADPEHFLDWDKPLSEQHPKVQEALQNLGVGPNKPSSLNIDTMERSPGEPMSGMDAYRALENQAGKTTLLKRDQPAPAYETLRDAGIPGIKYLDAGSRGKGDGTRNYVTFSDDIISILKKYGLAGLGIGTGAGLSHFQTQPDDPSTQ